MSAVDTNDPKDLPEVVEYQVIVKQIRRNVKVRSHEYKYLGTTTKNKFGDAEKEYGYVYFDEFVTRESEIYNQRIDDVDLPAIIKAANRMEK